MRERCGRIHGDDGEPDWQTPDLISQRVGIETDLSHQF